MASGNLEKDLVDALEATFLNASSEITLMDKADEVANALSEFARFAYNMGQGRPDAELDAAKEKVAAATKIVIEGRLAYALLRQLLEEVKYWPSWSKRDDFEQYKNLNCELLSAENNSVGDPNQRHEETVVKFIYNGRTYTFMFLDKGWSVLPGSTERYGVASLNDETGSVLSMECVLDGAVEFSYWQFLSLKVLRLKDVWTQDLLQIATDLELSREREREDYNNKEILEAARHIEL